MAKIVDPDNLFYADYTENALNVQPPTALNGGPANMLIDYQNKRFALTAPRYGTVGTGVSEMVGYGVTGGVSGQALYSKFKNIWKDDPVAIRFPFPMEAITPESFEFINGWLPDDNTLDASNGDTPFITRKLIKDAGWAERAPSGNIGQKWFGSISLGANALGPSGFTTVYYNPVNPGIQTSITADGTDAVVDTVNNTIRFDGVVGNGNTYSSAPYFYTGDAVVYQNDGTEAVAGITTNQVVFIRYQPTGAVPTGAGHSFSLHPTRDDALADTNTIDLTGSTASEVLTFTAAGTPLEFFFGITEEGTASNEPIKFFDSVQEGSVSAGTTVLYNHDNYYEIFVREEGETYGKQNNSDIGVSVINNQAYRFPLTSQEDINFDTDIGDGDGTTTGIGTAEYAGIGISFYQSPQTIDIGGQPYKFNIIVNADGQPLRTVYTKVQYLLRQATRVNSGIAGTDINSLSGVSYFNGDGAQTDFNNSFRLGAVQPSLLQFTGSRLDAQLVPDIFNLSNNDAATADNLGNLGIYIAGLDAGDTNNVRYLDNSRDPVENPFTSSVILTFNGNLSDDGDAKFWVFYDDATTTDRIIPGLSTSIRHDRAGDPGVDDGIVAATDEFIVGAGVSHPFVTGQKVVAISTSSEPITGLACTTSYDPKTLGAGGQGITTAIYYLNVVKSPGVEQTFNDIVESGDNSPGSTTLNVIGIGQTTAFKLHSSYSDAVANNYAGINTIAISPAGGTGVVTFTQLDVNFAENNATIVRSGSDPGTGVPANTFIDGIDIPSDGTATFSYNYESNDQRNRTPGNADFTGGRFDPAIRVVAVGLGTGQYAVAQQTIGRSKNQAISVTGALERVYSDPA